MATDIPKYTVSQDGKRVVLDDPEDALRYWQRYKPHIHRWQGMWVVELGNVSAWNSLAMAAVLRNRGA